MNAKTLLSLSAISFIFILLSANLDPESNNFVFSLFNEEPLLPEVPYEYSDITFPQHINNSQISNGYYSGEIDTTVLDFVDDDKSTLGRVLFYDKKLSANENLSCATCHKQEKSFADDTDFSQGVNNLTSRNSLQLNDLGWSNNFGFFWDMSFGDMSEMISLPLKDQNEIGADMDEIALKMEATTFYPELFQKAFGTSEITEDKIVEAITHFISSMVSFDSKFDHGANNDFINFSQQEIAGHLIFLETCSMCHFEGNSVSFPIESTGTESNMIVQEMPFLFTNGLEENPEDKGVGNWLEGYDKLYKVPTMRNIAETAPYMHDGRFETLDEVIDFYSEDVVSSNWNFFIPDGGFNFTDQEKTALKAFLKTLTDESFLTNPKWSDPFASPNAIVNEERIEMKVSPNPMAGFAVLEIDNPNNEDLNIYIYDATGALLKTDKINGSQITIYKDGLSTGMYSIHVQGRGKSSTARLIVQ